MGKGNIQYRDISVGLQAFRNFLLGRQHKTALRYQPDLAARSQPPPQLPDGVTHKHASNYYYTRDGRREVTHPLDVNKSLLEAGSDKGAPKQAKTITRTPGNVYQWDQHY